jgi:hypothetical protein
VDSNQIVWWSVMSMVKRRWTILFNWLNNSSVDSNQIVWWSVMSMVKRRWTILFNWLNNSSVDLFHNSMVLIAVHYLTVVRWIEQVYQSQPNSSMLVTTTRMWSPLITVMGLWTLIIRDHSSILTPSEKQQHQDMEPHSWHMEKTLVSITSGLIKW